MRRDLKIIYSFFALLSVLFCAGPSNATRYSAPREGLYKSVVRITCGNVAGTGTVVEICGAPGLDSCQWVIVTAGHVVSGQDDVTIFDGTRKIRGQVVGRDTSHDVAVIAARDLEMLDVVASPLLDRRAIVGEPVQQCGFASGRLESTQGKVLGSSDTETRCSGEAISGDSGSPFFIGGRVAGIVTNKTTFRVPEEGLLFTHYSQPKPAFIGTASLIVTAVLYAKPVIQKIIALYRAWKEFRSQVLPTQTSAQPTCRFLHRCDPAPEPAPMPPPLPEMEPAEPDGYSPWLILIGPGGAILAFVSGLSVAATLTIQRLMRRKK